MFKSYDDVPEHRRFSAFAEEYEDKNVWTEFCVEYEYDQGSSQRYRREVDRAGRHWLAHVDDRGTHHALSTPVDVEAWCAVLVEDKAIATAYNYWVRLKRFYDWLQWHVDHPHCYNPVLMAAAAGGSAGEIWAEKLRKWRAVEDSHG